MPPDRASLLASENSLVSGILEARGAKELAAAQRTFWERLLPPTVTRKWFMTPSSLSGGEAYEAARLLAQEGRLRDAELFLRHRLDMSSRAGHSYYLLGVVLVAQGRFNEGRAVIERAIRIRPWTRDLTTDELDLLPNLDEMAVEHSDWEWLEFQRLRHRFSSVGLTLNNAVYDCLDEDDTVVQIGANDGRRADPLRKLLRSRTKLRGLLVEPMPKAFAALAKNTADISDRFTCENVAIGEETQRATMYTDPSKPTTLSSFRPEQTMLGDSKGPLEPVEVQMMSLEDLLEKHNLERVGLFQTDTEGFDWVILRQLDVERYRPCVINVEHYSLTWKERIAMCNWLFEHGYAWRFGVMDMIAVDRARFGDTFAVFERWT